MSPDLFGGSAFRVGHILWCAQVSGGPPRQLPLSSLHSSSFLLTGSSSAACLPYRNDLNIRARLPSDFLHQPPRFHSANHPRLEEECLSCVLFFFFISLNSTSVWFSGLLVVFPGQRGFPSSLCGGVGCCCFMMKGFQLGYFTVYFTRHYLIELIQTSLFPIYLVVVVHDDHYSDFCVWTESPLFEIGGCTVNTTSRKNNFT